MLTTSIGLTLLPFVVEKTYDSATNRKESTKNTISTSPEINHFLKYVNGTAEIHVKIVNYTDSWLGYILSVEFNSFMFSPVSTTYEKSFGEKVETGSIKPKGDYSFKLGSFKKGIENILESSLTTNLFYRNNDNEKEKWALSKSTIKDEIWLKENLVSLLTRNRIHVGNLISKYETFKLDDFIKSLNQMKIEEFEKLNPRTEPYLRQGEYVFPNLSAVPDQKIKAERDRYIKILKNWIDKNVNQLYVDKSFWFYNKNSEFCNFVVTNNSNETATNVTIEIEFEQDVLFFGKNNEIKSIPAPEKILSLSSLLTGLAKSDPDLKYLEEKTAFQKAFKNMKLITDPVWLDVEEDSPTKKATIEIGKIRQGEQLSFGDYIIFPIKDEKEITANVKVISDSDSYEFPIKITFEKVV